MCIKDLSHFRRRRQKWEAPHQGCLPLFGGGRRGDAGHHRASPEAAKRRWRESTGEGSAPANGPLAYVDRAFAYPGLGAPRCARFFGGLPSSRRGCLSKNRRSAACAVARRGRATRAPSKKSRTTWGEARPRAPTCICRAPRVPRAQPDIDDGPVRVTSPPRSLARSCWPPNGTTSAPGRCRCPPNRSTTSTPRPLGGLPTGVLLSGQSLVDPFRGQHPRAAASLVPSRGQQGPHQTLQTLGTGPFVCSAPAECTWPATTKRPPGAAAEGPATQTCRSGIAGGSPARGRGTPAASSARAGRD